MIGAAESAAGAAESAAASADTPLRLDMLAPGCGSALGSPRSGYKVFGPKVVRGWAAQGGSWRLGGPRWFVAVGRPEVVRGVRHSCRRCLVICLMPRRIECDGNTCHLHARVLCEPKGAPEISEETKEPRRMEM